ncbi:MAG: DUF1501 domain-containing protein [Planctomycetota bacterium]|nr:DUF1501 domain-containing protein [Planctomycetota bacterium]
MEQVTPPATRREFIARGLCGAVGLSLAKGLGTRAMGDDALTIGPALAPRPAAKPVAKAKAAIQIWLWGGPSHVDTFDPKPAAGRDYCGPYGRALPTNVDGIQVSPMLPLLAKMADKYALLRGMTHGNNGHETAAYLVQAGRKPGGDLVYPGIGAMVSYFRGYSAGYKGILPPYITLTTPQGRFSEAGFLPSKFKPFSTGGDPSRDPFLVEGVMAVGITPERQKDRRTLLGELDSFAKAMGDNTLVKSVDVSQQQAYEMILGDAGKAFLLSEEKSDVRDRYGRSKFGQSCLLARRLVERGVPFITINHEGWDTHKQHFEAMGRKLPELDRALSALLQELSERGLLDSTIVWVSGEFGRTPKVQWEAPWNGGRGHYGKAFSALVAGGGFRGGTVVGKTDEHGETAVERPIYPWDLLGSMYALFGIDADATLTTPQGATVSVSPLAANEIPAKETGGLLKEIM